jgi:carboxyl-terminal processing protease
MRSRPLMIIFGVLAVIVLTTLACSAGFFAGAALTPSPASTVDNTTGEAEPTRTSRPLLPSLPLPGGSSNQASQPANVEELFVPFWQAWDLVHEQYVDQPLDDEALMRGAITGMLEALGDAHTSYLNPEHFRQQQSQLDGEEYTGIGAWVDISGDYLTIISPMPGSPAEKAGLRPADQIVGLDGEDMTGFDGEAVRQRVLGPAGTTVLLTIKREGVEAPFDVVVERATIVVPSVDVDILENEIVYVRLFTFGDDTAADLRKGLQEAMRSNPRGLILDLRNNGGGYLNTAIAVASEFIDSGVVMYEEHADGSETVFEARRGGTALDIPMVVLINGGSASASEIVAGAIQDRNRGVLVGVTSFGKGSVQVVTPLQNNQGAVRVTIARWLTPNKRQIHGLGLEPDHVVEIEDMFGDVDPQLQKAIELLTQP